MSLFSKKAVGLGPDTYLELAPVASCFIDSRGLVVNCNEAFKRLVGAGFKVGDLIGSTETGDDFDKAIRTGGDALEFDVKLKGEQEKAAHVFFKRIGDGKFSNPEIKFLVTIIDIQDRAALEQKLNHSQKMQAVGQLAGGVAHDFNNLLTAMNGFCDLLLQKHPPGDRSFSDLMQIKQNVNRAANLVRQLLAFSRKQVLKPKLVDITDSFSELSNLLRRLLGEHVNLVMRHGRGLWKVLADPGQIDQVTINLAVNARDAMMPKGGTLAIQTSNLEYDPERDRDSLRDFISPDPDDLMPKGEYVLIEIIDTGSGIPRDVLAKIFEPFFFN